jgi:hypothetical protein
MRFPAIKDVRKQLVAINQTASVAREDEDEGCDVRLQVYPDGQWAVRWGDSQYDLDHRGYWGASSVPGNRRRFNATEVARDLISQARDAHAESDED